MIAELLVMCLGIFTGDVPAMAVYPHNRTMCPCVNPYSVFQDNHHTNLHIPRDLYAFNPALMHEESVLHVVDNNKEFRLIGKGGNAEVYEAVLRTSGQNVVVKKLIEGGFDHLVQEARIMAYLQNISYVPKLHGLVPTGPTVHDMSMVVEYITNSTSVESLLLLGNQVSECAWVSILQQTTSALAEIHRRFVLFNDLHLNNVLVSWSGSWPKVHIIDFGHATFRKGKTFTNSGRSAGNYDFLPPEVWYNISTPASDVFSLGRAILHVSRYVQSPDLALLGSMCVSIDPQQRPPLHNIKDFIDDLAAMKCQIESTVPNETESILDISGKMAHVPLPLISWDTIDPMKSDDQYVWLRYSEQTHILQAKHTLTDMVVVVKIFVDIPFGDIRQEAIVNQAMNHTGFVPLFVGVTPTDSSLENLCIVQEYFANGQTLYDVRDVLQTLDFSVKIVLALELAEALAQFHAHGFLVNNLKSDNILVAFDNSVPEIRLIDLGKCSTNQGFVMGSKEDGMDDVDYLAPEVKENRLTSRASDVYSLGIVLSSLFIPEDGQAVSEILSLCLDTACTNRPSAANVKSMFMEVMLTYIRGGHDS